MPSLKDRIQQIFTPTEPLPAGVYHYQAPQDDPRNFRLHLRIEPDGNGILIVNASTVLHLNQTAAEFAYHFVNGDPEDLVASRITKRYRVSAAQARQDYSDFRERIESLINAPDLDPVTFLDFERRDPFTGAITAPYRLDCAITYQLADGSDPMAAPTSRVSRELDTAEWQAILDKAWQAGIPHVVFTGGEPTLRPDLVDLIRQAEQNGQVAGLLTDGLKLADPAYLDLLLQTGLDHLTIVLQTGLEDSWKALDNALDADIFVAVHLTLTPENQDQMPDLLVRLDQMGVKGISLSASDPALNETLQALRTQASELGLDLVWNLPVPYSALNPVSLETTTEEEPGAQERGAGRAWLYVEPDGDVLPAQGVNRVLGNFLRDPWEKIWLG